MTAACIFALPVLTGCNDAGAARGGEGAASGVSRSKSRTPSIDAPRWAKTVAWSGRGDTVALAIIEPWKGAREPLRYRLVAAPGHDAASSHAGEIPAVGRAARRIVCLAAVHTGFVTALGAGDRIVAVDARRHVYDEGVRAAIAAGSVLEVGSGATLDAERLLAVRPDLVLANAIGASEHAALERLRRAGIPVFVTAEWMENHPLARAEWVRVVGMLLGKEARADSLFTAVESSYRARAAVSRDRARKPTVLLGGPFRDQWFVSGGRSFMARLIEDAGGAYLWREDTTAGGVPLSFEAVLVRARSADVWLHPGNWRRLDDGARQDTRFSAFGAYARGDVYNSDARRHADGANDYWESGVVRPDRVLADLESIFHGHEDSLYYYRRLPP